MAHEYVIPMAELDHRPDARKGIHQQAADIAVRKHWLIYGDAASSSTTVQRRDSILVIVR